MHTYARAVLALPSILALLLVVGCNTNKNTNININGGSPTAPSESVQAQATVTKGILTFQCTALTAQTFQVSTNVAVTLSSTNTNVATMSPSSLPIGNDQVVTVTPHGSTAGTASIDIRQGTNGPILASVAISVECPGTTPPPPTAPTLTFTANPGTINSGGSSTLRWESANCVLPLVKSGGWSGNETNPNSSQSVSPTVSTTYNMRCNGSAPGSVIEKSVTVVVNTGTTSPPPVLTSIDYSPQGGSRAVGTQQQLTARCLDQFSNEISCGGNVEWSSSATNIFSVSSTGQLTAQLSALSVGSGVNVCATRGSLQKCYGWNATANAANLQVNQNSLTLQAPGATCVATSSTFVATSNQPITLSGYNTSLISVSTTTPASGQVVTVTGVVAGQTNITVTSGGETRIVQVTVNACQPPAVVFTLSPSFLQL